MKRSVSIVLVLMVGLLALVQPASSLQATMDGNNWTNIDSIKNQAGNVFILNSTFFCGANTTCTYNANGSVSISAVGGSVTGMSNPATDNFNVAGYNISNATNISAKNIGGVRYCCSNDTYPNIQDALNNLTAGRTNKETVIVNGIYNISTLITIPSNTILDWRGARLNWTGASGSGTKMFDASGTNIEIYGGNSSSNGADYHFWLSGKNIKLIGGNYSGFIGTAGLFRITGTTIEVTEVTAYNNGVAIGINVLNNAMDVNVHNNFFYNFSDNAIDSGSSDATSRLTRIKVNNNLISGGSGGGISFYSNITDSEAIGNTITDKGSRCFRISNQNGYGNPTNIKISDNQCFNFTYAAVWIQGSENLDVSNNMFESHTPLTESAILFATNSSYNASIKNNKIKITTDDTNVGIYINDAATGKTTIEGNEIMGGAAGISVKNNYNRIENNKITGNYYYAIELASSNNNSIKNNYLFNTPEGVREITANYNIIEENTLINVTTPFTTVGSQTVKNQNYGVSPFDHGNSANAPTAFGFGDEYSNSTSGLKYLANLTSIFNPYMTLNKFIAGSNITFTMNNTDGTLMINSTGGSGCTDCPNSSILALQTNDSYFNGSIFPNATQFRNDSNYISESTASKFYGWDKTFKDLLAAYITDFGTAVNTSVDKNLSNYTFSSNKLAGGWDYIMSNGSNNLSTGVKGDGIQMKYNGTITELSATARISGSINVSLWKDTYANYPPTVNDYIGSINITSSTKAQTIGLSISFNKGDWIFYNVDSVSGVNSTTVAVTTTRS